MYIKTTCKFKKIVYILICQLLIVLFNVLATGKLQNTVKTF